MHWWTPQVSKAFPAEVVNLFISLEATTKNTQQKFNESFTNGLVGSEYANTYIYINIILINLHIYFKWIFIILKW